MSDKKRSLRSRDIEKVISILNRITIFGGLSTKQLSFIFSLLQKVSYGAGEYVFRQGEEPGNIYIVLSGEIKIIVDVDGMPLEIIKFTTGQCFGEASVIGIQPHSANAFVFKDVELMVLPREMLLSIFESDKELFGLIILNIAREICRRLRRTDEVLLHYVTDEKQK